ncbi:hypothetical protein R6Q59_031095 [Mikania micrantha]
MARKSAKCPPAVEPNCVWNFGRMFDHHHHHQKLRPDDRRWVKSHPRAGHEGGQVQMLTFDEQLRNINIQSKKKTASVSRSLKKTLDKSFWKNIKSRYTNANKKKKNTKTVDRIVVLKPIERVVECPVDIWCRCLHLHPHQSPTSKSHIVKRTHVSFNDVRKKVKNSKNLKGFRKMKSCGENNDHGSATVNLKLVPYSKHQEPEVFVEARRHLAKRLRLVAMGAGVGLDVDEPSGSSCKQVSRTLERILLLSPIHESTAAFWCESEGAHGQKSLQKIWSGSTPLNQSEHSSARGFVEITDASDFLSHGSKVSKTGLDPNNIGPSQPGTYGCIERPQLDFLLDVSSPKVGCKSRNMDNEQFRENPSPVSVFDSFFTDNISSPTSTIESVEHHIQPRRLDFEEPLSETSSPPRENGLSSYTEDHGFISSYVSEMYQAALSNWEDFLATHSSCDHQVLHDYVKEVLVSLHSRITLIGSRVQSFSLEKNVINKVIDQVDWHNGQPMGPRTLDHLVRRDMARCEPWLDTLSERNDIVVEFEDEIFQELVIEAIHDVYV